MYVYINFDYVYRTANITTSLSDWNPKRTLCTYQKHIQMTVATAAAEKCLHFESMDFVHLHIDVGAVVAFFLFIRWLVRGSLINRIGRSAEQSVREKACVTTVAKWCEYIAVV